MPDDVEGKPFQDGPEPDDDRGGADEDFASVVFDEDFVRAAEIHEPSAVERLLAAAEARAEADAARSWAARRAPDGETYDTRGTYAPYGVDDADAFGGPYGRHGGALRPYRNSARWHRPVAWLLALLMGIGMIAFAFAAVYRGASGNRDGGPVPSPAATEVDKPAGGTYTGAGDGQGQGAGRPSASAEYTAPAASAQPRTP
ncbi:hypothetical protein [Streptomyces sp. NPDC051561]|uniref:SCO2584 family spore wall biosynthesis protein n=1 Tax=Streptomyces sp. NPDC051561 TaxID=3365658 RepID=UPI003790C525